VINILGSTTLKNVNGKSLIVQMDNSFKIIHAQLVKQIVLFVNILQNLSVMFV